MNDVIEPRLLALQEARRKAEEMYGLLYLAERAHGYESKNAAHSKSARSPAPFGRSDATCQAGIDEKEDGEPSRNRQDLEVLNVEVA